MFTLFDAPHRHCVYLPTCALCDGRYRHGVFRSQEDTGEEILMFDSQHKVNNTAKSHAAASIPGSKCAGKQWIVV